MIDSFPFLRYCQEEEKEDGAYRKILEILEDKLDDIYYCCLKINNGWKNNRKKYKCLIL